MPPESHVLRVLCSKLVPQIGCSPAMLIDACIQSHVAFEISQLQKRLSIKDRARVSLVFEQKSAVQKSHACTRQCQYRNFQKGLINNHHLRRARAQIIP